MVPSQLIWVSTPLADNPVLYEIILNCAKYLRSVITLEPVKTWLFELTMIRKKPTILYLLLICIATAPMSTANASDTEHIISMSENCIGCDMNDSGSHEFCDNAQCMLSTGVCGTQTGSGYIPELFWTTKLILPFVGSRHSCTTRFRSRLVFSIFRPPISWIRAAAR